ncbi:very short patch repair endonuclease [Oribacterium sp. C9]|uniref:very short patch repair endonuclease n=1 Tax=Oribacterium sp. C9 TaxID=1943579 RepID=UPI0009901AB3|nr:very short patch repair endonuclease [Oribacterium sp. C9]OON87441.1 very short patch repair endonuclease [Oribacterium sp. C9]
MISSHRKFNSVSDKTRKTMKRIKRKDTSIELALRRAIWSKGIRYRKNVKELPGTPDIVITKYNIAVFCDSEFFHGKDWEVLKPRLLKGNNPSYWVEKIEENMERDHNVDVQLQGMGYYVIHFWGKDILKNIEECVEVVMDAIMFQKISEI